MFDWDGVIENKNSDAPQYYYEEVVDKNAVQTGQYKVFKRFDSGSWAIARCFRLEYAREITNALNKSIEKPLLEKVK